jgi:thiamine-monophosphate kinase
MSFSSESEFLDFIARYFPRTHPHLVLGRDDDCALIKSKRTLCLSSDLFLEDIHFSRRYFSPLDIGYKALAVNISDISAMGAMPRGFLLNLMIPDGLDSLFWEQFFEGMANLAKQFDLALAGGDISRAPFLGIDITIWGEVADRWLERKRCQPGDIVFVIGPIGLARVGRMVLETGLDPIDYPKSVQCHLRPRLFVDQALRLAALSGVGGLMDVSDGLVRDLPRFLGPELGVHVALREEDLHQEVVQYTSRQNLSSLDFALKGGEDYSLLGCAQKKVLPVLQNAFSEWVYLGEVLSASGMSLHGKEFTSQGIDHFSQEIQK